MVLRLVVGYAFFIGHGLVKVRPNGEWDFGQAFVKMASDSAPAGLLYLAAWTEFLGGFALILGMLTRWAAFGILCIMAFAIFSVHAGDDYATIEMAIAYAGTCVAIMFVGPGTVSLDRLFWGREALIDK